MIHFSTLNRGILYLLMIPCTYLPQIIFQTSKEKISGSQTNKLLNEKEVSIEYTVFNEMGEDTGETAFSDVVIRSSVVKPEFRAKLNRGNATAGGTAWKTLCR